MKLYGLIEPLGGTQLVFLLMNWYMGRAMFFPLSSKSKP
jgi:hypothetical protein